jgi:hypothetical protein
MTCIEPPLDDCFRLGYKPARSWHGTWRMHDARLPLNPAGPRALRLA